MSPASDGRKKLDEDGWFSLPHESAGALLVVGGGGGGGAAFLRNGKGRQLQTTTFFFFLALSSLQRISVVLTDGHRSTGRIM